MEVYKKTKTTYEKFVNAFGWHEKRKYATREDLAKKAAERWKEMKGDPDAVQQYISTVPKVSGCKQTCLKFPVVSRASRAPSAAVSPMTPRLLVATSTSTISTTTHSTGVTSPRMPSFSPPVLVDFIVVANETNARNGLNYEVRLVSEFFKKHCSSLLTDDVLRNEAFVSSFSKCVVKISNFSELHDSYVSQMHRPNRKSKLQDNLKVLCEEMRKMLKLMNDAGAITINVSLGTHHLSVLANKKNALLSKILCSALDVTAIIDNKNILHLLRKRCNEQKSINKFVNTSKTKRYISTDMTLACQNSSLSWMQAYVNFDSNGMMYQLDKKIPLTLVRCTSERIESDTFVSAEDLNIESSQLNEIINAVVSSFPVLRLMRNGKTMLVDIHNLVLNGDALTNLLNGKDPIPVEDALTDEQDEHFYRPMFGPHRKTGRKPLHEKYPNLVSEVTSFIKQHSFAAHGRRRETTGTGVGVTLLQIREHVRHAIPEMIDISTDTIHHLMVPPRKGTIQAANYKSLVQARVPKTGKNNYRENHENQHFLFARVAYREEFCSKFSKECTFFSCDDMAKIRMGPAPAVSRYHQERRFFAVDDEPNLADHDTPNPGYLLCCSGYQQLVVNREQRQVVDEAYTAEDVNDIVDLTGFVIANEQHDAEKSYKNKFNDKLGRLHYFRYMSGPTKLVLRSVKFAPSNAMNHVNDLLPELDALSKKGTGIVFVKVDNGADWNLANLVNEIFFCRLWRDSNLDVLGICSYAARFSAYNNVEHTWAPMSKMLTSVILPSVLPGDEAEPYKLDLTKDEIQMKEAEVFDNGMRLITDNYWAGATFNGSEVNVTMEPSLSINYPYDDFDDVHDLIMGPYSPLINNVKMMGELRFMFSHIEKKSNEIIFRKCSRASCNHCTSRPIIAKNAWEVLKDKEFKWPNPTPSDNFPGHYKTFMEVDAEPPSSYITRDEGLPNSLKVGDCPFCSYMLMSASERDKHIKTLHRDCAQRMHVEHKCLHIIKENKCAKRCNLIFRSKYELAQHRNLVGHIRKRKKAVGQKKTPAKIPSRCLSMSKPDSNGFSSEENSETESDDNEDDVGHNCAGVRNNAVDDQTCEKCKGVYGPGSGDWLLCKTCANWYHEMCF